MLRLTSVLKMASSKLSTILHLSTVGLGGVSVTARLSNTCCYYISGFTCFHMCALELKHIERENFIYCL